MRSSSSLPTVPSGSSNASRSSLSGPPAGAGEPGVQLIPFRVMNRVTPSAWRRSSTAPPALGAGLMTRATRSGAASAGGARAGRTGVRTAEVLVVCCQEEPRPDQPTAGTVAVPRLLLTPARRARPRPRPRQWGTVRAVGKDASSCLATFPLGQREPRRREHCGTFMPAQGPPPRPAALPITVSGTFRTGLLGDADSSVASGTAPEPGSCGSSPVAMLRGQPADGEVGEDLGDLIDRQPAPREQLVEGLEAAEHPQDVERPRRRDVGG